MESEPVDDRELSWMDRQADHLFKFAAIAYPPLILGGAIFAYFFQPVLRFAVPYRAYEAAFVLALALMLTTLSLRLRRDYVALIVGIAGSALGFYMLNNVVENATQLASINDTRCEKIEIEMMNARPRRGDLPELFSALDCHTQTSVGIQFFDHPPRP